MRHSIPRAALRLALVYAVIAGLWVLLSDLLLSGLTADPRLLTRLQTFKGGAFVAVTALLLYLLMRRELQRLARRDAQIREVEERLHLRGTVLESAPNAIVITDREGRITWVNPAFTHLTGHTAAEALGQTPRLLKSGKHDPAFYRNLWGTILSGQVWRGEIINRRKDGRLYTGEETITPVRDAGGGISQFIGIQQDITERQQAESALRESEARFRNLVENTSDWVWEINERNAYTYASPRIRDILGYAPEEILGKTPFDLMPGEEAKRVAEILAPITGTHKPFELLENVNLHKDGHRVVLETSATPVFDDQGVFRGYRGIDRDIAARKRAEAALVKRTVQLEAIRALSTEITWELDLPTLLDLIIRRAVELVGVGSGQIFLWHEAAQVLSPGAWCGLGPWVQDLRLGLGESVSGTVAQRREGMIVNDYRTSRYAHPTVCERSPIAAVLSEPLLYRDRLVGVISIDDQGTGRSFTEEDQHLIRLFAAQVAIAIENARLYAESRQHAATLEARVRDRTRELDEARLEAEEASRHKSEFLANMSHELRTPLNSIIGFTELLQEQGIGPLTPKQVRYLGHVHQAGKHLLQLINDILDLTKVEAGRLALEPKALSISETLEDILVLARELAHKKAQGLYTEIAPDLPRLHADPVRFKQICFNLLSNAVKFTPDGGRIRVTARQVTGIGGRGSGEDPESRTPGPWHLTPGPWLEIRVSDTGIGIKPEDLPRLFTEFTQLEPAATKQHEGTGLGLALSKRLVELHGGRIWAESAGEGRGSTFTVLLPFEPPGN